MAGLEEQALWEDDVYQIETTDPVVGGAPDLAQGQGITNIPHLHLANRTAWLKKQVDTLNVLLENGLDQYVTDEQLATVIAGFVTQAAIEAAVNNLIAGAPAALNTLKELADELGDNDDAIAVLTAQIAGKLNASDYTATDILAKLKTVDGNGSGLDADFLDGLSSSAFVQSTRTISAGTGLTGGGSLAGNRTISASLPTQAEAEAGTNHSKLMTPLRTKQAVTKAINELIAGAPAALNTLKELADELADNDNAISALTTQIGTKLNTTSYTAADILAKLKTVDSNGSGLNADTLDGLQAAEFSRPISGQAWIDAGGEGRIAVHYSSSLQKFYIVPALADGSGDDFPKALVFDTALREWVIRGNPVLGGVSSTSFAQFYSGSSSTITNYPVGSIVTAYVSSPNHLTHNATVGLRRDSSGHIRYNGNGAALSGTWLTRGLVDGNLALVQRVL